MEAAAAGTQCPLSQASLVAAKMVIDDVTDVPGCGGEDLNRLTVDTNGIGADPGYGELKGTTPKTVAGAGCVHHLFLNGKDAGVTCPGATSIVVLGRGGNDQIGAYDYAKTGIPITIHGGAGADDVSAGGGIYRIFGEGGSDRLNGGGLGDLLSGGAGSDSLAAGDGDDTLIGGRGDDALRGGMDEDTLIGGRGTDDMAGAGGRDLLRARDGRRDKVIACGTGNDHAAVVDRGIDPDPHSC